MEEELVLLLDERVELEFEVVLSLALVSNPFFASEVDLGKPETGSDVSCERRKNDEAFFISDKRERRRKKSRTLLELGPNSSQATSA
jgi:hypothetical protein